MLKVAVPRPSSDAVIRGEGQVAFQPGFADDQDDLPVRALSRDEAEALRRRQPALSPWFVVLGQVVVGIVVAAVAGWLAGRDAALSALYGAAVVAVPGALMARGATSPLSSISPLASTASMLGWGFVKTGVAVVMLVLAPRVLQGLMWPVMLATLLVCMQTYWVALLWRGQGK